MLAEQESRAASEAVGGFAEAQAPFAPESPYRDEADIDDSDGRAHRTRYQTIASPLTALDRRKDQDGKPFLEDSVVRAWERLREDFEFAQMGPAGPKTGISF